MTRQEWQRAIREAYHRVEQEWVREWRIAGRYGYVQKQSVTLQTKIPEGIRVVHRRVLPRFD